MPLLLIALFVTTGCRTKPTDEQPPYYDREVLLKEQKRIDNGETVGQLLRAPRVIVTAQQVTINGSRVASRTDLESGGKPRKVDAVMAWVETLKEHWKALYPGALFAPAADVVLPEDISLVEAQSLIQTLANSGFAKSLTLHSGDASATLDVTMPTPLSSTDPPADAPTTIVELWSTAGAWTARRLGAVVGDGHPDQAARDSASFIETAPIACDPPESVSVTTVTSTLKSNCDPGCVAVMVGGTASFHDALVMASAALAPTSGKTRPTISFRVVQACGAIIAPLSLGQIGPATKDPGRGQLRQEATTVTGQLPPEVVQRIVRHNLGRFRRCYEDGLKTSPALHGRVVVKFGIDATGTVTAPTDGGSDLPDKTVVQCIVHGFDKLEFPAPEGGTVSVVYPMVFTAQD